MSNDFRQLQYMVCQRRCLLAMGSLVYQADLREHSPSCAVLMDLLKQPYIR